MVSGAIAPAGAERLMNEYVTYFSDLEFGFSTVVMFVCVCVYCGRYKSRKLDYFNCFKYLIQWH